MTENLITKIANKTQHLFTKWVARGIADEDRPRISGIYIDGDRMVGANGCVVLTAPVPDELKEHNGKVLRPLDCFYQSQNFIEWQPVDLRGIDFPDYKKLYSEEPPAIRFGIDKKYLKLLADLPGESNRVIFEVLEPTRPICVKNGEVDALVMPLHIGGE